MTKDQTASVTGPVSGGNRGWPFGATILDVEASGYREAEYFLEGTATRYQSANGTELEKDGHWQVEAAGTADFKTRLRRSRSDPA